MRVRHDRGDRGESVLAAQIAIMEAHLETFSRCRFFAVSGRAAVSKGKL